MSSILITTGSRLHFGLLGFGHSGQWQWGGLGVMIDEPVTAVQVSLADRLSATGIDAERALAVARQWSKSGGTCREVGAAIHVAQSPPPHMGLGSGTQLALAVGYALDRLHGRTGSIEQLAMRVGRTGRSSIGALGFCLGGLIYERGKQEGDTLGRLGDRVELPEAWRFVLVRPREMAGVSGDAESHAFRHLPPSDPAITARLIELAEKGILPAASAQDIEAFGGRLTEYNRLAGSFYESIQGGPYLNAEVATLIDRLSQAGASGVGQSSWGPTVFAVMPDAESAMQLVAQAGLERDEHFEWQIVAARNRGVEVSPPP